jgi:hypothetical protein
VQLLVIKDITSINFMILIRFGGLLFNRGASGNEITKAPAKRRFRPRITLVSHAANPYRYRIPNDLTVLWKH